MNIHCFLAIIFFVNLSFGLPRFAVQNGSSCIACHVNPTGSGLRNDYGTNVVALEELPLERWLDKGNEDWDGYISDHLQIGGDFRIQGIQYNDSDTTRKTAFFPMQADFYSHLKLNNNAGIFTKIGIRKSSTLSAEYWALVNNLPQNAWLRIGRTLPNYGLRVDDHTSFIRGGNLNKTGRLKDDLNKDGKLDKLSAYNREGLLFGPSLNPPAILELGVPMLGGLQWTTSISTSIINSSEKLNNLTTQFNYIGNINDNIAYMGGFSYMQEDNFSMLGISGGISFSDFTWTFEADQAENWIDGNTSIALYDEIAWEIIQGIHLIGKYDYFDPKTDWQTGSISRYTFGAEIYPLNIMEIKLQARFNQLDQDNSTTPDPEYLIQTHFWF